MRNTWISFPGNSVKRIRHKDLLDIKILRGTLSLLTLYCRTTIQPFCCVSFVLCGRVLSFVVDFLDYGLFSRSAKTMLKRLWNISKQLNPIAVIADFVSFKMLESFVLYLNSIVCCYYHRHHHSHYQCGDSQFNAFPPSINIFTHDRKRFICDLLSQTIDTHSHTHVYCVNRSFNCRHKFRMKQNLLRYFAVSFNSQLPSVGPIYFIRLSRHVFVWIAC